MVDRGAVQVDGKDLLVAGDLLQAGLQGVCHVEEEQQAAQILNNKVLISRH